jgi:hypothetical protein
MTIRPGLLSLAAAVLLAVSLGAQRADAASFLGSPDVSAAPDGFVCASCPPGTSVGYRQFALRRATLEAPESGVVVSASVQAKRIAGTEDPRIAILRPDDELGVSQTVVASAPVPVSSPTGSLQRVEGLHLRIETGDSIGFLFRAGEVDLGVRMRTRPDGAVQSFPQPCGPCGMDAGSGVELLLDAVVEPDVDADGLGDESQDPDGGGLGPDWEDDWFEDYDAGDELDEDFGDDQGSRPGRRALAVLDLDRLRGGHATLLVRVPKAGRVSASVTLPASRRTGAGPFLTTLTGETRARHPGRVRLRLDATPAGRRVLKRHKALRTKVVVALFPKGKAPLQLAMRSARL